MNINKNKWKKMFSKHFTIENNGCWRWNGARTKKGYGIYTIGKLRMQATKASWILFVDNKIKKGKEMCHKCDNPRCVNPKHLFWGTRKENMADCILKGRFKPGHVPGEKNGRAKLTDKKVLLIIKKLNNGTSRAKISKHYNVSDATIWFIQKGITWKHLKNNNKVDKAN